MIFSNNEKEVSFSICIITYNRAKELEFTLNEILKQEFEDFEIIVVNNNSSDGTKEILSNLASNYQPILRVFHLKENIGIGAFNIAFNSARGRYLVILDDDSHFKDKFALRLLLDAWGNLGKNGNIGGFAFKVIEGGSVPIFLKHLKSGNETTFFYGCGASLLKKAVLKCNGYDPWLFLYTNESELTYKMRLIGYKILGLPEVVVLHRLEPRRRKGSIAIYYGTRNSLFLIIKYFPFRLLFPYVLINIYVRFVEAIKSKQLEAYIRGMVDFFAIAPSLFIKRTPLDMDFMRLMNAEHEQIASKSGLRKFISRNFDKVFYG